AWRAANEKGTLEAYRKYRTHHPEGTHDTEAQGRIAPLLREALLEDPEGYAVRKEDRACRTAELLQADQRHVLVGLSVCYASCGALGGLCLGGAFGMVGSVKGVLIGSVIGGLLAGLFRPIRLKDAKSFAAGCFILAVFGAMLYLIVAATMTPRTGRTGLGLLA